MGGLHVIFIMGKKMKANSFEESINRLEEIVNKMESGESSLEQNLEWFEEGMDLIKTLLESNTYSGLEAKLKLQSWKRI